MRTEKKVMMAATRSSKECSASERMPRLPLKNPTTNLKTVMTIATNTLLRATLCFSARMLSWSNGSPGWVILSGPAAMLLPSPVNARDAEGVRSVGGLAEARGLHQREHLLRLRKARHARGKIGVWAARAGDQRADGGQHAAEVKAVELAQQTARLAEIEDCDLAVCGEHAVDLAQPRLIVGEIAKAEG